MIQNETEHQFTNGERLLMAWLDKLEEIVSFLLGPERIPAAQDSIEEGR